VPTKIHVTHRVELLLLKELEASLKIGTPWSSITVRVHELRITAPPATCCLEQVINCCPQLSLNQHILDTWELGMIVLSMRSLTVRHATTLYKGRRLVRMRIVAGRVLERTDIHHLLSLSFSAMCADSMHQYQCQYKDTYSHLGTR